VIKVDELKPIKYIFKTLNATNTIFLDRDGVLNNIVIRGENLSSPRSLAEFKVFEDLIALADSNINDNWNIVIVTNQPDLSRGLIDMGLLDVFHDQFLQHFPLNAVYVCPHLKTDGCNCRKPNRGLIDYFYTDFPKITGKAFFVGDRIADFECAKAAGIPFILRKHHYNGELTEKTKYIIQNLHELKNII
jgi:D-glycero-D-manno-heptose 1,7-bisphosphate phosphatase